MNQIMAAAAPPSTPAGMKTVFLFQDDSKDHHHSIDVHPGPAKASSASSNVAASQNCIGVRISKLKAEGIAHLADQLTEILLTKLGIDSSVQRKDLDPDAPVDVIEETYDDIGQLVGTWSIGPSFQDAASKQLVKPLIKPPLLSVITGKIEADFQYGATSNTVFCSLGFGKSDFSPVLDSFGIQHPDTLGMYLQIDKEQTRAGELVFTLKVSGDEALESYVVTVEG